MVFNIYNRNKFISILKWPNKIDIFNVNKSISIYHGGTLIYIIKQALYKAVQQ